MFTIGKQFLCYQGIVALVGHCGAEDNWCACADIAQGKLVKYEGKCHAIIANTFMHCEVPCLRAWAPCISYSRS